MPKKLIKFIPALLWMIFIFYLSSSPTDIVPGTDTQRFIFFKSLHLTEYAILFILVEYALGKFSHSLIISALYSITDEIHQLFVPGRHGKFTDIIIDLTGIFLGFIFLKIFFTHSGLKKLFRR